VKISGGGRCNVTHACFEPAQLVQFYPRGNKALRSAFHRFQPKDTIAWFAAEGVTLKTEADGRMFPDTDSSQTIIDCLLSKAERLGVEIWAECSLESIEPTHGPHRFKVQTSLGEYLAQNILLATGGNPQSKGVVLAQNMGHTIVPHVPSLFTFNIKDPRLEDLQGISFPEAEATIPALKLKAKGPILITHWGLSGPGILKLSAWAARQLHERGYKFEIAVNLLANVPENTLRDRIEAIKIDKAKQLVFKSGLGDFSYRFWISVAKAAGIHWYTRWADVNRLQIEGIIKELKQGTYQVDGKSTHKEEFVTCGGVELSEVDFRTMQSKRVPGLYFSGEILDIDGLTGGFNFQAAWTTGWIAGQALS
jgi:predicted Rossmann fold flavoprotein